jgi:flavodoxin
MRTAIVYYSQHHGNTKKILDAIAKTGDVTLIDVTKHSTYDLSNFDLIGFASGIYYNKFSEKVIVFAKNNLPSHKKVFFVYTCGIKLRSYTNAIRVAANERNADIVGAYGCPGFNTFGPFKIVGGIRKNRPNENDIVKAVQFFRGILK